MCVLPRSVRVVTWFTALVVLVTAIGCNPGGTRTGSNGNVTFSGEGGTVTIRHESGTRDRIMIEDDGDGIPAQHLERLFERFYRIDRARSRDLGGTGLGLAIVKHLALLHGGEVTVNSELEKGTIFTIHLPKA